MAHIYKLIIFIILIILLIIGIRMQVARRTTATLCCAAGKSGGHIIPCLTLAQQCNPDAQILFFSMSSPLDYALLASNPAVTHHVPLTLTPTHASPIKLCWQLARAWYISMYQLYYHAPTKIITTGGIVGIPVCVAAWILGIPIELYNLDAVPGKAAWWISRIADTTHVCFAQTQHAFGNCSCKISPYPVRFSAHDAQLTRIDACRLLGLDPDKKIVLIIGGSQGSQFLNHAIQYIVEQKKIQALQIIHQTGAADEANLKKLYQTQGITADVFSYRDDIAVCYAAADLIISRAGAGSLFEIAFFAKPSIIIPLQATTTDHQIDNAYAYQQQYPDLCTVIMQAEIEKNPALLYELIQKKLYTRNSTLGTRFTNPDRGMK